MLTLASDVRLLAPAVRLLSHHRFSNQLHADDLVVVADWEHDLQVSCDVLAAWARKWRFKFAVGPTKSAAMVFGPARLVPICAVTLAGVPLPQVSEYPYLGVTLTSSLTWVHHIRKLFARGNCLFAQCVSWCRSETSASGFRIKPLPHLRVAECIVGCRILFWVSSCCAAPR